MVERSLSISIQFKEGLEITTFPKNRCPTISNHDVRRDLFLHRDQTFGKRGWHTPRRIERCEAGKSSKKTECV